MIHSTSFVKSVYLIGIDELVGWVMIFYQQYNASTSVSRIGRIIQYNLIRHAVIVLLYELKLAFWTRTLACKLSARISDVSFCQNENSSKSAVVMSRYIE